MNIPTAHSSESLEKFLKHIKNSPAPAVVDKQYLKESGFKSGNDPELRHIARLLGFLDKDFRPTDNWVNYSVEGSKLLQELINRTYQQLFEVYPEAPKLSEEELMIWFQPPITGEARSSKERAVRTFKKLCQVAKLKSLNNSGAVADQPKVLQPKTDPVIAQPVIQLPVSRDPQVYEAIFQTMKKVYG